MAASEVPGPVFVPPRLTWEKTAPRKPGKTVVRHAKSEEEISITISISASEAIVGLEVV